MDKRDGVFSEFLILFLLNIPRVLRETGDEKVTGELSFGAS